MPETMLPGFTGNDPVEVYRSLLQMTRAYAELERKLQGTYALSGWDQPCNIPDRKAPAPVHVTPATNLAIATPTVKPVAVPPTSVPIPTVKPVGTTPTPAAEPVAVAPTTAADQTSLAVRNEVMAKLATTAANCVRCPLAKTRTKVVFGTGSSEARLVLVGEAPGYHEDQQGIPFVGEAGQLLTKMLAAIGLKREDVYICNVVKCRPPENREPQPEEIKACHDWLTQQLSLLQPSLICALGGFACHWLTGIAQPVGQYRGKLYEYEKIPVICTYHPAHLLYHPEEKRKAWLDLKRIRTFLDKAAGTANDLAPASNDAQEGDEA